MINYINTFSAPVVALGGIAANANSLIQQRGRYALVTLENSERYKINIFLKIIVNIMNITSGAIELTASAGRWVALALKNTSCIVYLRFFSVFAIAIHGVGSFIDLFSQVEKLHFLEKRIEIELESAINLKNSSKEKEIMLYKVIKYSEIMSATYSVALSIIAIAQFFNLMVFAPGVILTTVAIGGVLYSTSFILGKVYDIDRIEKRHFGAA